MQKALYADLCTGITFGFPFTAWGGVESVEIQKHAELDWNRLHWAVTSTFGMCKSDFLANTIAARKFDCSLTARSMKEHNIFVLFALQSEW